MTQTPEGGIHRSAAEKTAFTPVHEDQGRDGSESRQSVPEAVSRRSAQPLIVKQGCCSGEERRES